MLIFKDFIMKKKFFCFALIAFFCVNIFGLDYVHSLDDCAFQISVPESLFPGYPVKIQLTTISQNLQIKEATAYVRKINSNKNVSKAQFYSIEKNISKNQNLQVLVPLDSMVNPGEYKVIVTGKGILGNKEISFEKNYPLEIKDREFIKETLYLNASNTAIKTDSSKERNDQIERLNNILFTTNTDSIYSSGIFSLPTTSKRRTSFYGDRRIYEYSNGNSSTSLHYGIDFGIPTGTSVTACDRGKVVLVEFRISTGWTVVIEHMPGLYSLYYHMSKTLVEVGEIVEKDTEIALSGATGLATGPHLHWEVRLLGVAIDPDFFTENKLY